jgi:secondary thiamine-phosphate synthase enzyme
VEATAPVVDPLAEETMDTTVIDVTTGADLLTDLSTELERFCRGRGDGLCHVFAPHATAGLAVMETGAGSESDVAEAVGRLFPRDDRYTHHHGSPGHGADHVLPAFVSPSLTVPVTDGRPLLGTWQSVVLVDPNVDNPLRQVRFSFLAG